MENLSTKQLKAIALFCEGKKAVNIATELKCTKETLRRWGLNPDYRAALAKARAMVWFDAVSEAGVHVMNELAILQRISLDESASDSARVSAARAFIELTKPPAELTQDSIQEGDRQQVMILLPDNGRGDDFANPRYLEEED